MEGILLLGDSIRNGYSGYVKEKIGSYYNVYSPGDNARYSLHLLRYIQDYYNETIGKQIDLIFFNTGLWDIVRLSNENRCLISLQIYRENLIRIVGRLRHFWPESTLVFCTTTSVLEPCCIHDAVGG